MAAQEATEVLVKFTTHFEQYRIPPAAISVPASLNKAGLSQVISHILGGDVYDFEFFLASAQARELDARRRQAAAAAGNENEEAPITRPLLRGTLRKYARDLGLTTEDVLVLEYAPSVEPPSAGPSGDASEWIGALASIDSWVVAGLYDGTLALLPASALQASSSADVTALLGRPQAAHAGPVTGVSVFEGQSGAAATAAAAVFVASAGADGVVSLWQPSFPSSASSKTGKAGSTRLTAIATLDSSGEPCGGVALDPTGERVAAGDGTGTVYVWGTAAQEGEDDDMQGEDDAGRAGAGAGSKRKRDAPSSSSSAGAAVPRRKAKLELSEVHASGSQVSAVTWLGAGTLASGSWDHSIVLSDIEGGGDTIVTLRAGKVVTSLAASSQGGVLASGHPDGLVRVWDPRGRGSATSAGSNAAVLGLRGTLSVPAPGAPPSGAGAGPASGAVAPGAVGAQGSSWISSLAWCPTNAHLLAGTAYTGSVMLWDVRAPGAPLHVTPQAHSDKALAVAWLAAGAGASAGAGAGAGAGSAVSSESFLLLSGGADKKLHSARVSLPHVPGMSNKE